jgi:hypothetical protein
MNDIQKDILVARLKSLGWRVGMMVASLLVNWAISALTSWNLSPTITVALGLILGEVSKFLNTNLTAFKSN